MYKIQFLLAEHMFSLKKKKVLGVNYKVYYSNY